MQKNEKKRLPPRGTDLSWQGSVEAERSLDPYERGKVVTEKRLLATREGERLKKRPGDASHSLKNQRKGCGCHHPGGPRDQQKEEKVFKQGWLQKKGRSRLTSASANEAKAIWENREKSGSPG